MLQRIRAAHAAVAEIPPMTIDEWIDEFKRDEKPERELEIWERMGAVYQCTRHRQSFETTRICVLSG